MGAGLFEFRPAHVRFDRRHLAAAVARLPPPRQVVGQVEGFLAAAVGDGHAGEQAAELVVGPEDAHPHQYTANFKKWVALEALRGDLTAQAIAAKHEIPSEPGGAWKRQAIDGLEEVFAGGTASRDSGHEATIRDLHAKFGELTVERDFCLTCDQVEMYCSARTRWQSAFGSARWSAGCVPSRPWRQTAADVFCPCVIGPVCACLGAVCRNVRLGARYRTHAAVGVALDFVENSSRLFVCLRRRSFGWKASRGAVTRCLRGGLLLGA